MEDPGERHVSREQLRLELKSLKSELRLMIIASVALNQFLTNVTLPSSVAVPAIVGAIVAPGIKAVLVFMRAH